METIKVLISAEELDQRIKVLSNEIAEYYNGKEIYAICVLKGGVVFMVDLAKSLSKSVVEMNFMTVSSYGSGTESGGIINVIMDMEEDLTGKNVLFVEDIVDSGRTIDFLVNRAKQRNAADVKVCTLLYKPEKKVFDVEMDFVGFEIPNDFVVGYGLDYDQKYRNLSYIGTLSFD